MQASKRKRTGEDTEHSIKNQNACKGTICSDITCEAGFGNLSECGESSSSELSKRVTYALSDGVVSLASFVGDTMLCRCAGMFVRSSCDNATFVLTSACLVKSSDDESKIIDNLTIKVRLPNDQVVIGLLHHYDLKYDIVVVNIERAHGFRAANIGSRRHIQFEPNTKVVAVGRCFDSGTLATTKGIVIGRLSDGLCELVVSTCKINMMVTLLG